MRQLVALACLIIIFGHSLEAQLIVRGRNPKLIALTFDDGPSTPYTEKVLAALKKEQVKATFFMVGKKIVAKPDLLDQAILGGHEIGNHTYYHSRLNWLTEPKLLEEIKLTSQIVSGYTNGAVRLNLFRPPHGFLPRSKSAAIQKAGYNVVMWSVNADDFYHASRGVRGPTSIAQRVLGRIHGGDIVLMHDNSQQTVDSLPYIIKALKRKGYRFVTVSELLRGRYQLALQKPASEENKSVIVLPTGKIKPESFYQESPPSYGLPLPDSLDQPADQKSGR
ncbi:MAG: polysaccharide deacetylase family protein [Candidatus Margulisiibacteriota bacterium]